MKKLFILALSFFSLLGASAFAQTSEIEPKTGYGYAFATPLVLIGDGEVTRTLTLGAGAEGLIKGGLGVSADLGYLSGGGVGIFSPGVVYQFRTTRKTLPFVTGGYTMVFRQGIYNLIHFGGGFNHWFRNRWGLRLEGRNHMDPRSPEYNFLQVRVAFLFR